MNREILFRGKRLDNHAWETGSLVVIRCGCHDEQTFIADKMTGYHTPVNPATIGQYTGLTDKNGIKIFEKDIVRAEWIGKKTAEVTFEVGMYRAHGLSLITWANDAYGAEVVGNIHDNPELVGGQDDTRLD